MEKSPNKIWFDKMIGETRLLAAKYNKVTVENWKTFSKQ